MRYTDLKKGELVAYAKFGRLYPGVFKGYGGSGAMHFYGLWQHNIDRVKEGKKPLVDFINSSFKDRVVRISPTELETSDKAIYDQLINLI